MLRQLTPSTVYRIYNMPSTRPAGHARSSVFTAASMVAWFVTV
jgi:hypothetical protein